MELVLLLLFATVLTAILQPGYSQPSYYETQTLEIEGSDGPDFFGRSLDYSGTSTLAVGAPFKEVDGRPLAGAVYVYDKDEAAPVGEKWSLRSIIVEPAETNESYFGFGDGVTIEGDTLAVGAYQVGTNNTFVLIFGYIESDWLFTQAIPAKDRNGRRASFTYNSFYTREWSLDMSESILAFVASTPEGRNAVRVYDHIGPGHVANEQILQSDSIPSLGMALAIVEGDSVLATSGEQGDYPYTFGAMYLFQKDPTTGTFVRKQRVTDGSVDSEFGDRIAADGNLVVASLFEYDNYPGVIFNVYFMEAGELVYKGSNRVVDHYDDFAIFAVSNGTLGTLTRVDPLDPWYVATAIRENMGKRVNPPLSVIPLLHDDDDAGVCVRIAMAGGIIAVSSVVRPDDKNKGRVHLIQYLEEPPPPLPTPVPTAEGTPPLPTPAPTTEPTPPLPTPVPTAEDTPLLPTPAPTAEGTPPLPTPAPTAEETPPLPTLVPTAEETLPLPTLVPTAEDTPLLPTLVPTAEGTSAHLSIRKFVLIDADSDNRIASLTDGDAFDRSDIGTSLNIKAATRGPVESVVFELNGVEYSTEDQFPYALGGDNPRGDYNRVSELAAAGTYTVTATPYSGPGGTGMAGFAASITITIT